MAYCVDSHIAPSLICFLLPSHFSHLSFSSSCPVHPPPLFRYAFALADFADDVICKHPNDSSKPVPARLWTSTLRRTRDTARHISSVPIMVDGYPWVQMKPRVWSNLDEIYAGACDGFTYPEV